MSILKMVHTCVECDKTFTRQEAEAHSQIADHNIVKELSGQTVNKETYLKHDDIPFSLAAENKALKNTLSRVILEEREWQERMLKWIEDQKRRFSNAA